MTQEAANYSTSCQQTGQKSAILCTVQHKELQTLLVV